jgi:NADPH-dependent glutamate synthase beta subunit-like oxidoreductase
VRKAVDLLRQATAGEDFGTPRRAAVIGGGNVAMDIARTLAGLQRQTYRQGAASQNADRSIGCREALDSAALHPDYKRRLPGILAQSLGCVN